MSKYKIEWSEKKTTSTGKVMIKATLKDDKGAEFTDVAIWDSFPKFEEIMTGHEIEGDLVVKQNGQYENKSLYPIKQVNSSPRASGGFKVAGIKEAQETKARNIAQAQDRSALMWAKYGACELVTHHPAYRDLTREEIVSVIEELSTKIYNGELLEPFN